MKRPDKSDCFIIGMAVGAILMAVCLNITGAIK